MTDKFIGPGEVARHLGVGRSAVSNWLQRHADTVPEPNGMVGDRPIWLESRLPEWSRWFVSRRRQPAVDTAALRKLAQEWLDHHEYDETDDGSADTGGENGAYHACGAALNGLLDELTGVPRCVACGQHIHLHEATGLWASANDITTGACYMNLRPGANTSTNGRHVPKIQ